MALEYYGLKLSPPCWTVQNVGHYLGLEFNFHEVDVVTGGQHDEEFVKLNPQHTIPTIIDGDLTLWESRAIVQYLANKYDATGTLYPADPELRAKVDQKLFFDLGLFAKIREHYLAKLANMPVCDPERFKNLEQQIGFLDVALQDHEYVAGDAVTIADFSLMSTMTICEMAKFPFENYPNVAKWFELCKESVPGIYVDEESQSLVKRLVEETEAAVEEAKAAAAAAEEGEEAAAAEE